MRQNWDISNQNGTNLDTSNQNGTKLGNIKLKWCNIGTYQIKNGTNLGDIKKSNKNLEKNVRT